MLFNKLFNNISWIKETDLIYIIKNQQRFLKIENDYNLSFQDTIEQENLNKIINLFKKEIIDDYFNKRLDMTFKLCKLTETEYFMYMFRFFLMENKLDENRAFLFLNKEDMYEHELIWQNQNGCEDWNYVLTDFSKTFHKIYLITETYCKNNTNIQKIIPYIKNSNSCEEIKKTLQENCFIVIRR